MPCWRRRAGAAIGWATRPPPTRRPRGCRIRTPATTAGSLDLERAIATLPAGARQVLVLVGIYGHSHEEAAAMLGVAVGTCKSQLHRARQMLTERLAVPEDIS